MNTLGVMLAAAFCAGVVFLYLRSRSGPPSAVLGRRAPGYGEKHENRGGLTRDHWRDVLKLEKDTTGKNERSVRQFVQNLTIAGVWHHLKDLGFDPVGPVAVALHETGYGLSYAASEYDNLFGISYTDKSQGKDRPYRFDSLPHCLEFFDGMMSWSMYRHALAWAKEPKDFVVALHAAGFNPSDAWLRAVLGYVEELEAYIGS